MNVNLNCQSCIHKALNKIFGLIILTLVFTSYLSAQSCKVYEGEVYYLKTKSLNLRIRPDLNSGIIEKLDQDKHHLTILHEDSIINGFVLVKATYDTAEFEPYRTITVSENTGWVSLAYLDLVGDSRELVKEIPSNRERIESMIRTHERYKSINSCLYNPTELCYGYLELGKKHYFKNEYIIAIQLFTTAIEIATSNSLEEKYLAIYYRGLSKDMAKDYYGAIRDFKELVDLPNKKPYGKYVIGWEFLSKDQFYPIVGLTAPIIDEENLHIKLAFCYALTNQFNQAFAHTNKIITTNKKSKDGYYVRALIHFFADNIPEGCKDASIAGELGQEKAYELIAKHCN